MRKHRIFIGFLAISSAIYSQSLGLEAILKRVEEANPEVKIRELDVKISEKARKKAFRNLILPPISLSSENDWETAKNEGFGIEKLEATIPVFQGGRMVYGYKKSNKELEMSRENKNLSVFLQQEAGVDEYFKALNYRQQREVTNSVIEALEKQKVRLSALYSHNKLIAKSEVLKVEADIENNKALNLRNAQKERAAKQTLMQLLGYEIEKDVTLEEFQPESYLKSLETLEKSTNPKDTTFGRAENLKVEIAEYNLKIAKADLYPTLYVKPSHSFKEENKNTNKYETTNEGRVEVGISYTFGWGATLDSVSQSEYKLEQTELSYDKNISTLKLNMKNKLEEIEALSAQSKAGEKRVYLLKENLKIDSLRYMNELVSTFDYLNSVNQLRLAQEDYYKLQRSLVLAIIEYQNLYK
ncbi:MAG: TolC family protein [Fusobacteriaceae bacterium]